MDIFIRHGSDRTKQ